MDAHVAAMRGHGGYIAPILLHRTHASNARRRCILCCTPPPRMQMHAAAAAAMAAVTRPACSDRRRISALGLEDGEVLLLEVQNPWDV